MGGSRGNRDHDEIEASWSVSLSRPWITCDAHRRGGEAGGQPQAALDSATAQAPNTPVPAKRHIAHGPDSLATGGFRGRNRRTKALSQFALVHVVLSGPLGPTGFSAPLRASRPIECRPCCSMLNVPRDVRLAHGDAMFHRCFDGRQEPSWAFSSGGTAWRSTALSRSTVPAA